jgi:tellurite resistance protein
MSTLPVPTTHAPQFAVPASLFSAVLGLVGLGNCWRMAHPLWGYPLGVAQGIHALAISSWLILLALFAVKWMQNTAAAKAHTCHGIQGNFVALVPISSMLIALAIAPYSQALATAAFLSGLLGWLLFALWQGGRAFTHGGAAANPTHALYIPWVAGNFSAALVSSSLGWTGWDQMFFGAGVLSWLAVESVVLQRVLTGDPMPAALRATLGIQLAPPAVGLVAYLAVASQPSALVVHMLLGYAVLQALLMMRLLPWICAQGWSMSYWSVSFGATGLALGALRWLAHSASAPALALAGLLFYIANGVVALLLVGSVWEVLRSLHTTDVRPGVTR